MIRFMKKNPVIPPKWIILTALAYSLTTAQAQTLQEHGIRLQTV